MIPPGLHFVFYSAGDGGFRQVGESFLPGLALCSLRACGCVLLRFPGRVPGCAPCGYVFVSRPLCVCVCMCVGMYVSACGCLRYMSIRIQEGHVCVAGS